MFAIKCNYLLYRSTIINYESVANHFIKLADAFEKYCCASLFKKKLWKVESLPSEYDIVKLNAHWWRGWQFIRQGDCYLNLLSISGLATDHSLLNTRVRHWIRGKSRLVKRPQLSKPPSNAFVNSCAIYNITTTTLKELQEFSVLQSITPISQEINTNLIIQADWFMETNFFYNDNEQAIPSACTNTFFITRDVWSITVPCCAICSAEKAELHRSSVLSQVFPRAGRGAQISGVATPFVVWSPHGTDTEPTEGGTGCERSLRSAEWDYQLLLRKWTHTEF